MQDTSASTARSAPIPPEGSGLLPFTETDDGKVELVAELKPGYEEECARKQERLSLVHGFALLSSALLVTAGTAWISGAHGSLGEEIITRKVLAYALFFGEMASLEVMRRTVVSFGTPMVLAFLYAFGILNGISFSVFLLFLPAGALAYGFLISALTFGTMSAYGAIRGVDLSRTRNVMALFAVGIAWMVLLSFVLNLEKWSNPTAAVGLAAFGALYAFHLEDIHEMWIDAGGASNAWRAAALNAALIYLEFLNLYGYIMRSPRNE
ncbi:MAG TPA: Bax inhibitor-1 family protein [candidate division Zixibacteria bacterium]|nr:Bax inhibitor-1 family protein [candidate division Zixibacteria bacterium]